MTTLHTVVNEISDARRSISSERNALIAISGIDASGKGYFTERLVAALQAVGVRAVIDDYTRECLAIRADRHFRSRNVIETLADLMAGRGVPDHIRSDNRPEFTSKAIQ